MDNTVECQIKHLQVFHDFTEGKYFGITKEYFPKWDGWKMIARGEEGAVIELAAIEFYKKFFYAPLYLDHIKSPYITALVLGFATLHGKRKATAKLQQVLGLEQTGVPIPTMLDGINLMSKSILPSLLNEILEFYYYLGKPEDGRWAIDVYRRAKKHSLSEAS